MLHLDVVKKKISFRWSNRDRVIFSVLYSFIASTETFYIWFRSCNLLCRGDRSTGQAPTAMLIPCLYGREDKVRDRGWWLSSRSADVQSVYSEDKQRYLSSQFIRNEWEKKASSALELLNQLDMRLMVGKFSFQTLKKLYRSFDPAAVERKAQWVLVFSSRQRFRIRRWKCFLQRLGVLSITD